MYFPILRLRGKDNKTNEVIRNVETWTSLEPLEIERTLDMSLCVQL